MDIIGVVPLNFNTVHVRKLFSTHFLKGVMVLFSVLFLGLFHIPSVDYSLGYLGLLTV